MAEQSDDLAAYQKRGQLPSTLTHARRSLTNFLNRIRYVHIPAIKENRVFELVSDDLQRALFGVRDLGFGRMMKEVAVGVNDQVASLIDEFATATGIKSMLVPPMTPEGLFRFSVNTEYETDPDYMIHLDLRGDGVRTRYIPSILNFIAANSSRFYIWGFEEPENSLEYRLAMEMAQDFLNTYCNSAQIFATSHSQAFISLYESPRVETYRVYSQNGDTQLVSLKEPNLKAVAASGNVDLLHELGISALQSEVHDHYAEQIALYSYARNKLDTMMATATQPVLLTEGKTDVAILTVAWEKLRGRTPCPFRIENCDNTPALAGGSGGYAKLKATLESVRPDAPSMLLGLFDRDKAGIEAFSKLSGFQPVPGIADAKSHLNGKAIAILLPVPPGKDEFAKYLNLPIEFYFSEAALRTKAPTGHGLELKPIVLKKEFNGVELAAEVPTELWFHRIESGKVAFAEEVVPTLASAEFTPFSGLFGLVDQALAK